MKCIIHLVVLFSSIFVIHSQVKSDSSLEISIENVFLECLIEFHSLQEIFEILSMEKRRQRRSTPWSNQRSCYFDEQF